MPKEVRAPTQQHRINPLAASSTRGPTQQGQTRSASTWTPQDDEILMSARASGLNWQPIATRHFPNKTANACRKRHERLMERRNAEDWDGVKLETLAREYMLVRKEMWSILAARVGEKWQLVEAKCMEKGFKNLQSAHRSAQRKERGIYKDDSGIDCSDAENEIDEGHIGVSSVGAAQQASQQVQGGMPSSSVQRGGPSIQSMLSPSPAHAPHPHPPQPHTHPHPNPS